jgi:hypothetical protein
MDINYSMEEGLINFYALNDTHEQEAAGWYGDFIVGGTEDDLINDGLGPEIKLFLNSSDFISGDKVNETPLLIVELSDEDGINTAGNIGHSLTAIVDGKAMLTYNLNEYYRSDVGTYTRGSISYLLPELSEGKHTLMFRAWDMMNNSSSVTIEFEVVRGLSANILRVQTMPDLQHGTTTFEILHDRPENEVEVKIEVFDMSGRIQWRHSELFLSSNNTYSYCWNQCGSSGQPLSEGVYVYRIIVSSLSGSSTSKAKKVSIIR